MLKGRQVEFPSAANRSTAIIPEVHCEHVSEARTLFFGVRNYTRRAGVLTHTRTQSPFLFVLVRCVRHQNLDVYIQTRRRRTVHRTGRCLPNLNFRG
jgi:hypothetical protein